MLPARPPRKPLSNEHDELPYKKIIDESSLEFEIPSKKIHRPPKKQPRRKRTALKPRVPAIKEKDPLKRINLHHIALALHTTGYVLTIAHTHDKRKKRRAIRSLSATISEILEEILI